MYKHILFAVEFGKGTDLVMNHLKDLMHVCHNPKLSLIHVVELPSYDIYPDVPQEKKEAQYLELATQQLAVVGKKLNVPLIDQYVEMGDPKELITNFIGQHNVDLLIVGHHERHGIYRMLGSTAYALLCHAKCHVLILPYPCL